MLYNALADAMVLTFANGSQVAQTLVGCLVERLQQLQRFLAFDSQFPLLVGLAQRAQYAFVVILADEPTGAVTSVVGEIERHIALRRLRIVKVRQLAIVVQIVRTCQPGVGFDFFTGCLGCNGQGRAQQKDG